MGGKYEETVIYRTLELFLNPGLNRLSVTDIAKQVNRELAPPNPLTRESVYKIISEAKHIGLVQLHPPLNRRLKEELATRFSNSHINFIVVELQSKGDNAKVAEAAAAHLVRIVREIGRQRAIKSVGLGLGPGRATLDFCRSFGLMIKSEPSFPRLRLVSISAGCPATMPEYASSSFFHLFPGELVEEKIGLFAESLVRVEDFERVKKTPGVHEAFEARDSNVIDVVVTSMGDFSDPHDLLGTFLKDVGVKSEDFAERKWVGNVQYRPFTSSGPVEESKDDWRAVTLFELSDLVQMARLRNKHVILIARQCGKCGKTRAKALLPLLTNPELRVCSDLIIDSATARELINLRG